MAKQSSEPDIKRLYLSSTEKKISGVCGGIGEYFGVDPTLIRFSWIIVTVMTGLFPGLIAYLTMAIVTPEKPNKSDK